jgi:hypothetical protein
MSKTILPIVVNTNINNNSGFHASLEMHGAVSQRWQCAIVPAKIAFAASFFTVRPIFTSITLIDSG